MGRLSPCQVSIIIPTLNRAILLKKCLSRLKEQSIGKTELIIVNNGSQDETKQVISEFLNNPRFRYVYEPKKGPSLARNRGFKKSRGEIIAFLDDDCLVSRNWLGKIRKFFKNPSHRDDVLQGKLIHRFPVENFQTRIFFLKQEIDWQSIKASRGWRLGRYINFLNSGNFAVRREVLEKLHCVFDSGLFPFVGEERDLAMRLQLAGSKIIYSSSVSATHLKAKPKVFRSWQKSFFYGRAEGILREKYLTGGKKKKVFSNLRGIFDKVPSFPKRTFLLAGFFRSYGLPYYLGVVGYLFLAEFFYSLGKIYGRLIIRARRNVDRRRLLPWFFR